MVRFVGCWKILGQRVGIQVAGMRPMDMIFSHLQIFYK